MVKLTRFTMPIFAGNAAQTQTSVFGTMKTSPQYTSDVAASIGTTAYGNGWADAIEIGYAPYLEDMNTVQRAITYQIAYNQQEGIPEWASDTTYFKGSWAKYNATNGAQIYESLVDNNVGNLVSDNTKWKLVLDTANGYVTTNTAQTITGAKTFTSNYIVHKGGYPRYQQYNTDCVKGTAPANNETMAVQFMDANGNLLGTVQTDYVTSKKTLTQLRVYKAQGASDSNSTSIGVGYNEDGNAYTWALSPSLASNASDYANQIVTVGYLNGSNSGVVHLLGTETITGTKTFQADPIIKNGAPRLYISDPNQTKGTANGTQWSAVEFQDNNGARLGLVRQLNDSTKLNRVEFLVEKANASGDNSQATMSLYYPASGNPYATAPASSVANSIVTTIAKNWDSTNKKGYYQLGNGLIVQWGFSDTSGTVTVRFPKAFTTTNYTIVGISYGATICVVDKNSKTTDTVSVGNTVGFDWLAIGY